MDKYNDRRSDKNPRGKRERASFNPNFDNGNRLKRDTRYNRFEGRPQVARNERQGGEQGGEYGRRKSYNNAGYSRFGGEGQQSYNRYSSESRGNRYQQGGYKQAAGNSEGYGDWNDWRCHISVFTCIIAFLWKEDKRRFVPYALVGVVVFLFKPQRLIPVAAEHGRIHIHKVFQTPFFQP